MGGAGAGGGVPCFSGTGQGFPSCFLLFFVPQNSQLSSLYLSTQGALTPLLHKFQYLIDGPSLNFVGWETPMERQVS